MVTYRIAPNFKWYFLDKDGQPAAGGKFYTRKSTDPTTPKPVFADSNGFIPYDNPITLDAAGGLPVPLYWEDDGVDLYWVQVKDKDGNILETINNFPLDGGGGVTPVTNNVDIENHIINGQFNFIDAKDEASSIITNIPSSVPGGTRVAPASGYLKDSDGNYVNQINDVKAGWLFFKEGGGNVSDSIKFEKVTNIGLGLPDEPSANAPRYFTYQATSGGDPVTGLTLEQYIPGVESFSGDQVTLSFETKGTSAAPAVVSFYQNFGTGSAEVPVSTGFNINYSSGAWARQSVVFTVPTVAGKTVGPNKDDFVSIRIGFPLNTIGTFSVANIQFQRGNFGSPAFIYQTYNQTQYKVLIDLLSRGTIPPFARTGDVKFSMQSSASEGWIVVTDDNDTIGSAASLASPFNRDDAFNLFSLIWNTFDDSKAPVSSGRGATAAIDWAANKTIRFPQYVGRVIAGSGTGLGLPTHNIGDALGLESVTLTESEIPPHQHSRKFQTFNAEAVGTDVFFEPRSDVEAGDTLKTTGLTGGGAAHENRQPTNYLYLHVKL